MQGIPGGLERPDRDPVAGVPRGRPGGRAAVTRLCDSYRPRSGCRVFRVAGRWRIPALWAPGSDYVIPITARSDYVIARRPVTMAGMVPGGLERPDRDPVAGTATDQTSLPVPLTSRRPVRVPNRNRRRTVSTLQRMMVAASVTVTRRVCTSSFSMTYRRPATVGGFGT